MTLPQIEAIYHTSIVVAGAEYYFGGGINVARAGHTPFGRPIQVHRRLLFAPLLWPAHGGLRGTPRDRCSGCRTAGMPSPLLAPIPRSCAAGAGPGAHPAAGGCAGGAAGRPERALHTR